VSSARYKRDIRDMGAASSGLMKLRPVVFRYRSDPQGQQQYGLIAEEVARVYPELVDYDKTVSR
jgi:Chaperone of endosialidase